MGLPFVLYPFSYYLQKIDKEATLRSRGSDSEEEQLFAIVGRTEGLEDLEDPEPELEARRF